MADALRILVVEDEFISRNLILSFLKPLGACDEAQDAREAMAAVRLALERNTPYQLICLDIKLPDQDGQAVLLAIRQLEARHGVQPGTGAKIIMTTAVDDPQRIMKSFEDQAEAYLLKPITPQRLLDEIRRLGLIN